MSINLPSMATLQSRTQLTDDTLLFRIVADLPAASFISFHPGQFVQLSVPGVGEMPISYCGVPADDGSIELCVRCVGRVSSALGRLPTGAQLGLRGPLGHGFPTERYSGKNLLLIAGGVGMAPIRSLLLALLQQRGQYRELTVLHGAREARGLLFEDEVAGLAASADFQYATTVDRADSQIHSGCRVGLLPALLDGCSFDPDTTVAALCAPPVAYPALIEKLRQHGIPDDNIHVSLERQMKCGIGRCGHCAVGSLLCCVDGPVFSLSQLSTTEGVAL